MDLNVLQFPLCDVFHITWYISPDLEVPEIPGKASKVGLYGLFLQFQLYIAFIQPVGKVSWKSLISSLSMIRFTFLFLHLTKKQTKPKTVTE